MRNPAIPGNHHDSPQVDIVQSEIVLSELPRESNYSHLTIKEGFSSGLCFVLVQLLQDVGGPSNLSKVPDNRGNSWREDFFNDCHRVAFLTHIFKQFIEKSFLLIKCLKNEMLFLYWVRETAPAVFREKHENTCSVVRRNEKIRKKAFVKKHPTLNWIFARLDF